MALQWGLEWQQCYVEALLETDAVNLAARVAIAERVILSRVEQLCISSGEDEEWRAIEDAISGLSVLKREMLKAPIGTKKDRRPDIVKPRISVS
jgi:hypothetical protein